MVGSRENSFQKVFAFAFLLSFFFNLAPVIAAIPTISNVASTPVNSTKVDITWDTDETTNTTLYYGISSGIYPSNRTNASFLTSHNMSLTNLSVNTTYFYYINATKSLSESNISLQFNFTTSYEDLIRPNVTLLNPTNNSFWNTDLLINASLTEDVNCSYLVEPFYNGTNLTSSGLYYYSTVSLPDGRYNITVNCTDPAGHIGTAKSYNVTLDTISPEIEIVSPTENEIIVGHKIQFNLTINDTNIDKVWYTENLNTTKHIISGVSSTVSKLYNITLDYPGKEIVYLYANDSAGNLEYTDIIFYANDFINITAWKQGLYFYSDDLISVEAFNSSFSIQNGNISLGNQTLELNFTGVSVRIYNMSSANLSWPLFIAAYDSNSSFEEEVYAELGTYPEDYVGFLNFSGFDNDPDDYYARFRFPHNISAYDLVYYCPEEELSDCEVVEACNSNSYEETNTTPCYNSTISSLYVYVPHLSSVFATNDSLAPLINITAPLNRSNLTSSYLNDIDFTTNENATCGFSINSTGSYTSLSGSARKIFSTNFSSYFNRYHNMTVNCTDIYGNSGLSRIYFMMNDTTKPTLSLTVSSLTTSVLIQATTNEPSNITITLTGETAKTNASFSLSYEGNFTGLTEGTTYTYSVIACDKLSNCRNTSSTKKTTSSTSESTSGETSSSSTVGSNSTSSVVKISQLWQSPEAGDYTLNVPTINLAITQIDFTLLNDVAEDILFTIEKITTLPGSITQINNVFQYIKIEKTIISDSNISAVVFKFRVEKSWITANNIDPETIVLQRYSQGWTKLSTKKKSSDSTYYYYESDSPGMSYLAISGDYNLEQSQPEAQPSQQQAQPENTPVQETDNAAKETESPQENTPSEIKPKIGSFTLLPAILGIIVLAAVVSGIFIFMMTKQQAVTDLNKPLSASAITELSKPSLNPMEELAAYIEKCKAEGMIFKDIKNSLTKAGWHESIIDSAMGKIDIPLTETDSIKNYIVEMKKYEKTDDEIKAALKSAGWQEDIIKEFFHK